MAEASILPKDSKAIIINHDGKPLTILVDAEDYPLLSRHTWYIRSATVTNFYPATTLLVRDTKLRKLIAMHHIIMGVGLVDHINGNKMDNRKCNLRKATYYQNAANSKKITFRVGKPTSSKYKGVTWGKIDKKWKATISRDDKRYNLGQYVNEDDAARAYNKKAIEIYGEFARPNIIEDNTK